MAASCTIRTKHGAYTAMFGLDPGMIARAMSSRPLWILGYPDRAEARARETLQLARSQRQPITLVFALLVTQGDAPGSRRGGRSGGASATRLSHSAANTDCRRSANGAARSRALHSPRSVGSMKASNSSPRASPCSGRLAPVSSAARFSAVLADLLRFAGRIDDGLRAVDEGFAHAEQFAEGGYLAELHRARAELLRVQRRQRRGGSQLRCGRRVRARPAGTIVRAASSDRLGAAADRVRPSGRGTRGARTGLSMVYRRPEHRRPGRRAGDAVARRDRVFCNECPLSRQVAGTLPAKRAQPPRGTDSATIQTRDPGCCTHSHRRALANASSAS